MLLGGGIRRLAPITKAMLNAFAGLLRGVIEAEDPACAAFKYQ